MLLVAALLLAAPAARAGRSCDVRKPSASNIERGLTLAQRTAADLDASGAQVVILARAGQDLSKYGLRYSHMGLAYREADTVSGGVWRVVHKLNQCGTADAAIHRQGLGEFFLDDPWRYEAAWAVPSVEVQRQLLPVLRDDRRAVALHHKPYSIVSYAWGRKYQQSNQWVIETLASAIEPTTTTRARAQAWLQVKGYQPGTLQVGALTRLGGRLSAANVAFDDHPVEKRFSDRIETVTADSVFQWLQRAGLATAPSVVTVP